MENDRIILVRKVNADMPKFDFKGILTQNNQVKELSIDILVPYYNHKFKLYFGERLEDMVENAKLVGLKYILTIVKENLSEDESEMYVIEINLMQRGFNDLLISEQATVLKYRHSQTFSESKRKDIILELQLLEDKENYSPMENKKRLL